ncbi:MAG TPA: DUF6328 family protein [Polyangia bacterium]|nr:DUF6328 family protein [Polyangia bacterium]
MAEPNLSEFDREWTELLNEVRVVLPGVQILFAFLLTVPFSDRFLALHAQMHRTFFACVLLTTGASAFLTAPTVYHRLHWRRDVVDKEQMLRTCNRLAIAGVTLLALAMSTAVFTISVAVFTGPARIIASGSALTGFALLWFFLPLRHRARDRARRE